MNVDTTFRGVEIDPQLEGEFPLDAEIRSSYLGLTARFEDVDTIFTPSKGFKFRFSYERYDEAFGGDFDANKLWVNAYKWWRLGDKWTLGLRGDGQFSHGDLPFFLLPYIDLRGIPMQRYAGNDVVVGETEARWQFHPRVSVLGFVGIGWAATSPSELTDSPSRVSKGVGIRYYTARKLGMHAGVDVA